MRYHLWFVHFSQNEPHGVTGLPRCNGRKPGLPLLRHAVRAAAPRCIHMAALSSFHQPEALLAVPVHITLPLPRSMRNIAYYCLFVNCSTSENGRDLYNLCRLYFYRCFLDTASAMRSRLSSASWMLLSYSFWNRTSRTKSCAIRAVADPA